MRFADEDQKLPQEMVIPDHPNYIFRIDGSVWSKKTNKKLSVFVQAKRCLVQMDGKMVSIRKILENTYFKGIDKETVLMHKNGVVSDCAVWNLVPIDRKEFLLRVGKNGDRRPVRKTAPDGTITFYKSAREAARDNHVNESYIGKIANGSRHWRSDHVGPDGSLYEWDEDCEDVYGEYGKVD